MLVAPSGEIVVAGTFIDALRVDGRAFPANPGNGNNAFLLDLDRDGHLVWQRTFLTNWTPLDLGVDDAGNLFVAGSVGQFADPADLGTGTLAGPLVVAKLDSRGNTVWARAADGLLSGATQLGSVALGVSPAGEVALLGYGDAASAPQGFIALLDALGTVVWQKSVAESLIPSAVIFDARGDILIAGRFSGAFALGPMPPTASLWRGFVAALDILGNVRSVRALGEGSDVRALAAAGSRTLVAGQFNGAMTLDGASAVAQGTQDLFVAFLDDGAAAPPAPAALVTFPAGNDIWDAIAPDGSGGAVGLAEINDFIDLGAGLLAPPGIVIARVDAAGHLAASMTFDAPDGARGRSLALDAAGDVIAFGSFEGRIDLGTGALSGTRTFEQTLFVSKYITAPAAVTGPRQPCPPTVPGALLSSPALAANPQSLLLQGDRLYFSTDTEVMSLPLAGGTPTVLAHAQRGVTTLAADQRALYWTSPGTPSWLGPGHDGAISSVPLAGGAVTVLADHQNAPGGLAVDEASVYWTAAGAPASDGSNTSLDGQLLGMPKGGGAAAVLASALPDPGPVAVGGGFVVFASGTSAFGAVSGQIQSLAIGAGTVRAVASTDRQVSALATDGTTAFWTDANSPTVDVSSDDGRLRSVPLAGGGPALLAAGRLGPRFLTLVGDQLYWGEAGSFGNRSSGIKGAIWRMPKAGGVPGAVVDHLPALLAFSADDTHIAWVQSVDTSSGTWALEARSR